MLQLLAPIADADIPPWLIEAEEKANLNKLEQQRRSEYLDMYLLGFTQLQELGANKRGLIYDKISKNDICDLDLDRRYYQSFQRNLKSREFFEELCRKTRMKMNEFTLWRLALHQDRQQQDYYEKFVNMTKYTQEDKLNMPITNFKINLSNAKKEVADNKVFLLLPINKRHVQQIERMYGDPANGEQAETKNTFRLQQQVYDKLPAGEQQQNDVYTQVQTENRMLVFIKTYECSEDKAQINLFDYLFADKSQSFTALREDFEQLYDQFLKSFNKKYYIESQFALKNVEDFTPEQLAQISLLGYPKLPALVILVELISQHQSRTHKYTTPSQYYQQVNNIFSVSFTNIDDADVQQQQQPQNKEFVVLMDGSSTYKDIQKLLNEKYYKNTSQPDFAEHIYIK